MNNSHWAVEDRVDYAMLKSELEGIEHRIKLLNNSMNTVEMKMLHIRDKYRKS